MCDHHILERCLTLTAYNNITQYYYIFDYTPMSILFLNSFTSAVLVKLFREKDYLGMMLVSVNYINILRNTLL